MPSRAGSLAEIGNRPALAVVAGLILAFVSFVAPASVAASADPCVGAFSTAAEYGDAFSDVAQFGTGWVTADGYVPVALPDGRTAWLMSDTLLGPPAVSGDTPTFVHNSIVVQRGRCLTAVLGGTVEQRTDLVPETDGRWCWQSAGVARARTLLVFCTIVEAADGPPGFAFRVVGSAVATFDLPGLTFRGMSPLPFAEPGAVSWGTSAVRVGDTVYVYGVATGSAYVARVPFAGVTTGMVVLDGAGVARARRHRADDLHPRKPDRSAGRRRVRDRLRRGRVPTHPAGSDHRRLDGAPSAGTVATAWPVGHRFHHRRAVRVRAARRRSRNRGVDGDLQRQRPRGHNHRPDRLRRPFRHSRAPRSGSDELVEGRMNTLADGHVAATVAGEGDRLALRL